MNSNLQQDIARIAERASEWLEVLADKPGASERAAFAVWIAESPLHVREFLNIAAIDRLLDDVDPLRQLPIETRLKTTVSNIVDVHCLNRAAEKTPLGRIRHWRIAAGIAIVAATAGGIFWWQRTSGWQEYVTAVGEQSAVQLTDGTVVNLNTSSRLEVRFSERTRDVSLLEGEALFTVRQDSSRPFRVHAGPSLIQAIGTAFNVRRFASGVTTVAVIEGKVQISAGKGDPPKLVAGEQVAIEANGRIERRENTGLAAVTAWRERRLVFHRATLEEIASEFNRYNSSPQIHVEDPELRARRYTVVLPADDPESLIDYLRQSPDVRFSFEGQRVSIRPLVPSSQ